MRRVSSAVTGAAKGAITDAASPPTNSTVEKWKNFPGKQLKKWTGLG
ncbi:hypothetical protein M2272_004107 [Mycobacterium frederiksbergense]|uniref:Uncharacterized protein n=1 Tax=Mycolicibacterium frederiksbergense TaxID=117567 RepID=A0ABT6L3C0_9MYCO|nr:hypothetical protein [Mycolicibacterium frederiksbergense]MDH6197452.1 hypothetical protein [Mycolicibacterium frederiksbergense]